jgi:cysteinyl-tRNA synthetase
MARINVVSGVAQGTSRNDTIFGDNTDLNVIGGNGGNDIIRGRGGMDVVDGGKGNDKIYGDGGSDFLSGGAGIDTLYGGSGKDFFVFETKPSRTNDDVIADYKVKDDTVVLDRSIFKNLPKGEALKGSAFWTGTDAHDANDRIIYDKATGALYYDADGTGAAAKVQFAQLSPNLSMTAKEFLIV